MLKLSIVTPDGAHFEGNVDYIIVSGNNGQFGILPNHVPVISPIDNGFIKRVTEQESLFTVISGGVLEYSNNEITVIAQEAATETTLDNALIKLQNIRSDIKKENKRRLIDFAEMERQLALNIKEIKASKL